MRRFVFIILILSTVSACRSTNPSQTYTAKTVADPLIITLADSSTDTPIDNMPFQFWLQTKPQPILATNRTKGALNYTSQNANLDIPVSEAAIKCMRLVFSTIAASSIKTSKQWLDFKKRFPYRFLELLPVLKDFYSERTNGQPYNFSQLTVPILWNGFQAAGAARSTEAGFKVRGYLKWSGVLLPDGNTCMVATSAQVLELLELSLSCEDGKLTSCNIPTENVP